MGWARGLAPVVALALGGLAAQGWGQSAARVTVKQVDNLGNTLAAEQYVYTDAVFTSVAAPERSGKRFTYWAVEPAQPGFVNRDAWGRALDAVQLTPKDSVVTLTAVYADAAADTDDDDIPDADERYWYGTASAYDTEGSLQWDAASDTDGDGYTLDEELQYGMNPLFPNELKLGGVAYGDSTTVLYNPNGYVPYTVRSEPEGELFATYSAYVRPGTVITTKESFSPDDSTFAYWTVNGVRQADAWGVATNKATFTMGSEPIEAVAHCVADAQSRQAYYWYGGDVGPDSDTDGDGYTLAEELQYGMNPIFPNELKLGGVAYGDSEVLLYNPNEYPEVTIRSEPEGVFATESLVLRPGQEHTTGTYTPDDRFAQWTRNGERQADAWGRALDAVTIVGNPGVGKVELVADFVDNEHTRLSRYWYGVDDQAEDSDTDGDGYTFAEEMQYGLNPLFPNVLQLGGVAYGDGPVMETNLQPFDMGSQALVENVLEELFATLDGATGDLTGGMTFNGPVSVAVLDVDADDNFDFLVYDGSLRLFHNIGTPGSPEWKITEAAQIEITKDARVTKESLQILQEALGTLTRPVMVGGETELGPAVWFCDNGGAVSRCDLATGTITETGLAGFPVWDKSAGLGVFADNALTLGNQTLTLDAAVESPCAAALADATGDGAADLLVADTQGRIALYARTADGFALEHRVWGGSFIGFAEGLTLAPVDWEADGDLDMLCGTATGKLLLLSDPNVGRPSNLRATAGYDNVLLTWDPNGQSRVYGYGVYRAQGGDFARIAEASLPTHRDTPPTIATWSYRVTALSRLWTAGNSVPETFESQPSETVRADLGGVTLSLPGGDAFLGQSFEAIVSIDNSAGLAADGFSLTLTYDPKQVEPLGFTPSALTEGLALTETHSDGTWTLSATGGAIAPGAGELLRLRFKAVAEKPCDSTLTLVKATFTANGKDVSVCLPTDSAVFHLTTQPDPVAVTLSAQDAVADETGTATVTVSVETDDALNWGTLTLTPTFDETLLTLKGYTPATAEKPRATFSFAVTEAGWEAREAEIAFAGAAQGTDGSAALVSRTQCRVLIPDEEDGDGDDEHGNRPGWRPLVALSAPNLAVAEGETVTIPVAVTELGFLDWRTLEITPVYDTDTLELVESHVEVSELYREIWFTFRVLEAPESGWHRDVTVRFEGAGVGYNGAEAIVRPAVSVLRVEGRPHPDVVVPWTNGDCDGDGRLTGNDYQVAFRTVKRCHPNGNKRPAHSEEDWRVHRALCQAIGKPIDADLRLADVTNTYKKWLWARGVTDTNMGNGNGGKK